MEVYKAQVDGKGDLLRDADGRLIKGELTRIFVMEKRTGWGAEYDDELRNGGWEYAHFTPDGQPSPQVDTNLCFQCHKPMSSQDFVFTLPQLSAAPQ
jgi:Cytochrome P460